MKIQIIFYVVFIQIFSIANGQIKEITCIINGSNCRFTNVTIERDDIVIFKGTPGAFNSITNISFETSKVYALSNVIFTTFPKMNFLTVSSSSVKEIGPETFLKAAGLWHLKMDNNGISELLDYQFKGAGSLKIVNLEQNAIKRIEINAFKDLQNLNSINLGANRLSYIQKELFRSNLRLVNVVLKNNQIISISTTAFRGIKSLEMVELAGNRCIDWNYALKSDGDRESFENALYLMCPMENYNLEQLGELERDVDEIFMDLKSKFMLIQEYRNEKYQCNV
jgi:Leucine-rich repeat (LRR) protein